MCCWILLNCLYNFLCRQVGRILCFVLDKLLYMIIYYTLITKQLIFVNNVRRIYKLINWLRLKGLNTIIINTSACSVLPSIIRAALPNFSSVNAFNKRLFDGRASVWNEFKGYNYELLVKRMISLSTHVRFGRYRFVMSRCIRCWAKITKTHVPVNVCLVIET